MNGERETFASQGNRLEFDREKSLIVAHRLKSVHEPYIMTILFSKKPHFNFKKLIIKNIIFNRRVVQTYVKTK